MERLELVSPHVTLGYDTAAFRNDLKALLTRTGVEGENTVFFLEDHQIVRPEFLEACQERWMGLQRRTNRCNGSTPPAGGRCSRNVSSRARSRGRWRWIRR